MLSDRLVANPGFSTFNVKKVNIDVVERICSYEWGYSLKLKICGKKIRHKTAFIFIMIILVYFYINF